ncbi:MAG: DUF349 domain-containing protein [Acidobacteria bacterium]|nr:DUF349 domain-containing protein [Acidobacteriota bacterium]
MGLLDKLKPQPRWKHADPAVRLDAVRELDDQVELAALAESDPDVRVRRAATARVSTPAALGRIAANDADAELRDRAADRLVALATRVLATDDAAGLELALSALGELSDPRRLSTIAKSDAAEPVTQAALTRLSGERALGSVARQARHASTAADALARLTDPNELVEVALHAVSAEIALAAFDRIAADGPGVAQLRAIESAAHKNVARKARTMIQELEAAEAARLAAVEDRRRRASALCDAVEQVGSLTDVAAARAELARVVDAWKALAIGEPELVERFQRGQAAADVCLTRREREAAEAADLRRLRAEAIATRDALCARVETLDGDDALEQLIPIEEEWRSLLPLVGNGPEADRLAERFAQAVAACRKRHEMGALLAEQRAALEALVAEAERLPADDAGALPRWDTLSREARGVAAVLNDSGRPAADLLNRLAVVAERFDALAKARQAAIDAAAEQARQAVLNQFRHLTERAKRAAEADSITLREGERLIRDITAAFDTAARAAAWHEIDEAVARLRALQEQIAPRVRELREMDEWRRFANGQRQEQLIAMAEAIVGSLRGDEEAGRPSDLAATARALRELHTKWQEVAEAPRQNAQRLWDRFRAATDFIRARCETHFAKQREERRAALDRKKEIVEAAETLATSQDWTKTAETLQQLQAEWQTLGPVPREIGRELSQRFRTACSTFFTRRREDLTDRKKAWTENLAAKETLCAQAEALAESTDWEAVGAEMKRLQAAWKTIGPVRRSRSEAIWNRFRSAADTFFTRYHNRHEITLNAKLAEREALVVELESIANNDPTALPADLSDRVQQLRTTWNRSVPIPAPGMRVLNDRWQTAIGRVVMLAPQVFAGTDLDPTAVLRKMEKLVARVESFLGDITDQPAGLSPTEMLAAKLRSALASNAIGGRASDDAKWRAAADAVKEAQAAWQRLPPVAEPEARVLSARFREACRQITDRSRRQASPNRRPQEREVAAV